MSNHNVKRPNAHKHGIFSATAILPGEDQREFDDLHSASVNEWTPTGETEEDAVLSIAKAIWRKRRLQRFIEVRIRSNEVDPNHTSYFETLGLWGFKMIMMTEPEKAFEQYAIRFLHSGRIKYFLQKFPRSKFKSDQEWRNAVMAEIDSIMATPDLITSEHVEIFRLQRSAESVPDDMFRQELALDERLDAMIDRAVKRLIQMKAIKQMLDQTVPETEAKRPKGITRSSEG
jgi:hypothetical protein